MNNKIDQANIISSIFVITKITYNLLFFLTGIIENEKGSILFGNFFSLVHRTQETVCSCSLPAPLQTVRKSTASDFSSSNQTNRGAIRPHNNRNETGLRKNFTNHKTSSSLSSGLNTPLFLHTLHRSRICKKF